MIFLPINLSVPYMIYPRTIKPASMSAQNPVTAPAPTMPGIKEDIGVGGDIRGGSPAHIGAIFRGRRDRQWG